MPELLRKVCFASAQGGDEQEGARGALQVQELRSELRKWMKGHPGSEEERETWRGEGETSEMSRASTPSSIYEPRRSLW